MPMTPQEVLIYNYLRSIEDNAYLTPDGEAIYMLTDEGLVRLTSNLDRSVVADSDALDEFTRLNLTIH